MGLLALQGCLFNRVLETPAQLCDEQPTPTDRDVILIVSLDPTATADSGAVRELLYAARPVHRPLDSSADFVARLSFTQLRGEYRLAQIEIPKKFNAVLPRPLLDAAVKVTCKAQIAFVPPRTTFDLTVVDKATLPSRDGLMQLLGPPAAPNLHGDPLAYQYCLLLCDAKAPTVASLAFWFDPRGELQRAEASYFRYSTLVDLATSQPKATIQLH